MLDSMPEVVSLTRPERFGSFVLRLTPAGDLNGLANESHLRRELQAKILTQFADVVRANAGVRLQVSQSIN